MCVLLSCYCRHKPKAISSLEVAFAGLLQYSTHKDDPSIQGHHYAFTDAAAWFAVGMLQRLVLLCGLAVVCCWLNVY